MTTHFPLQPTLAGPTLTLSPLHTDDWTGLYAIARDPEVWAQHPAPDRWREAVFHPYFEANLASGGALTARLSATGQIIGWSRFCQDYVEPDEVEIGWTMLGRPWWGGAFNREMKALMLDHAFQHVSRVLLRIGVDNHRSRRAAEKIGARLTDRVWPAGTHGLATDHLGYVIERSV